jgi:hypothetical protein
MSQFDDNTSQTRSPHLSAEAFVEALATNVDNHRMSAEAFRSLVRSLLPAVQSLRNQSSSTVQAYPGTAGTQFDDRMLER